MAEIIVLLIHSGDLMRQVLLKREVAASRNATANDVLGNWLPVFSKAAGFHRLLPLPAGRSLIALVAQAAQAGITLAPPGALQ
jgi:DNA-binding transcriptional MocR family regulator